MCGWCLTSTRQSLIMQTKEIWVNSTVGCRSTYSLHPCNESQSELISICPVTKQINRHQAHCLVKAAPNVFRCEQLKHETGHSQIFQCLSRILKHFKLNENVLILMQFALPLPCATPEFAQDVVCRVNDMEIRVDSVTIVFTWENWLGRFRAELFGRLTFNSVSLLTSATESTGQISESFRQFISSH